MRIVVVGIGGGAGNMLAYVFENNPYDIEFIAVDTDPQEMEHKNAHIKVLIEKSSERNSFQSIQSLLKGADLVYILAALGGETATSTAPAIAQISEEAGALTIPIVTMPFTFEGHQRSIAAEEGLEALKMKSSAVVVIPNDKLLAVVNKDIGLQESFNIINDVMSRTIIGIRNILLSGNDNDININLDDLQTITRHRGLAMVGMGEGRGVQAAINALQTAMKPTLSFRETIDGAMGILLHFTLHPDFPMIEIGEAMGIIESKVHEDADIIFGTTTDTSIPVDCVRVTLIATGFDPIPTVPTVPANNLFFRPQ
jgi:cell division protein FtsZ